MSAIRNRLRLQYRRARRSVREGPVGTVGPETDLRFPAFGDMRQDAQPPTVLVHGYKDDASVFAPLAQHLSELGVRTYAVTLAPSDCSVPLEVLAQQLKAYISSNFAYNQQLNFVGFSLGGIVARYYLQRMGGLERTGRRHWRRGCGGRSECYGLDKQPGGRCHHRPVPAGWLGFLPGCQDEMTTKHLESYR